MYLIIDYKLPSENKLIKLLEKYGYDSIVYKNQYEDIGSDSYVIFKSTQIKNKPNIYKNTNL